jgi:hypothetical protein
MAARLERHLEWDGVFNVRDLGGLPTSDGGVVVDGALVRADSVLRLSAAGWRALREHGVRTIVDLRDPEVETGLYAEAAGDVDLVRIPVLRFADDEFWRSVRGERDACRFYLAALTRWPVEFGAAVRAVAGARAGGVLVHCQVGKDRTGLVTALILAAIGVPPAEIAADYDLSRVRLARFYELAAEDGELAATAQHAQLAIRNGSRAAAMAELLELLDVAAYLQGAGVSADDLSALRARLVG